MYNLNSIDEELLGIKDDRLKKLDIKYSRASLPPLIWLSIRILFKNLKAYISFIFIFFGFSLSAWLYTQIANNQFYSFTLRDIILTTLSSILLCLLILVAEVICELILFQPITFLCKLFKFKKNKLNHQKVLFNRMGLFKIISFDNLAFLYH